MQEVSDGALAARARRGDKDAFGELVERHQTAVFNVCYRILGERREAEDLAQEAFLRAYRRLATFDEQRPFGPWVRKVAANLCLNHLQKQRPEAGAFEEEYEGVELAATSHAEESQRAAEQTEMLRAAILSLPPHYRAVIELRHYQELSYGEIGETLNMPLSDVKSHLFRARKALAELLKDSGAIE